jgi:hypothetical protein
VTYDIAKYRKERQGNIFPILSGNLLVHSPEDPHSVYLVQTLYLASGTLGRNVPRYGMRFGQFILFSKSNGKAFTNYLT